MEKYKRLRDWKKYQTVWSHWKTAIKWKIYKREAEIASFRRKKEVILEHKASKYYQTTLLSRILLAWHVFIQNESKVVPSKIDRDRAITEETARRTITKSQTVH